MNSLTGKLSSSRGWALLFTLVLGGGLMVAACGEEDTPTPTTPAPTPPPAPTPTPEPEPEPPAVPTGLRISDKGADFIEWAWTMVEGVSGYDVQFSTNEAFTSEDEIIARTAEQISYRRDGLEAEASGHLRVRSAAGTGDDRITSAWSDHVSGMTDAAAPEPPPVTAPATPAGFRVSEETATSITWSWSAVPGAAGYVVQISADEMFEQMFEGADQYQVTTGTSYTASGLDPETTRYARVAAGTLTAPTPSTDPADYLLSAWTTHATGMTESATPLAPSGLRLKDKGHNFIEWEWEEVPGVNGYESEFSTDGITFSGYERHAGRSATSRRVSGLDPGARGYLRVRSYTGSGTGADTVRGDWSPADGQTTGEPPPVVTENLGVPGNFRAASRTETSITLEWSQVEDAVGYEVDQKLTTENSWGAAGCGSEGVVIVTTCETTGLTRGTEYDFRVRALADDDDETKLNSNWSGTVSRQTAGRTTQPIVTETSDLNIGWKSDTTSITWDWDPVEDRALRERTEHLVQVLEADRSCADIDYTGTAWADGDNDSAGSSPGWQNHGKNISLTRGGTTVLSAGDVRGLCVVRTWLNELTGGTNVRVYGDPETVWASTVPAVPSGVSDNPAVRENQDTRSTTFLEWTFEADAGFLYPGRLVSRGRDETATLDCETSGEEVTAPAEATTSNVQSRHRETTRLNPYTEYKLCLQAKNDDGRSDLVVIGTDMGLTRPAAPRSVMYSATESDVSTHPSGTHVARRIVWSVPETAGTPRNATKYTSLIIKSSKSGVAAGDVSDVCSTTATALSSTDLYALVTSTDRDAAAGIEVMASSATDVIGAADTADAGIYYFYACVRAEPDGDAAAADDHGPWKISAPQRFTRRLNPPGSFRGTSAANSAEVVLTWTRAPHATGYLVQHDTSADFSSATDVTISDATTITTTVSGTAGERVYFRIRSVATGDGQIGGAALNGAWWPISVTVR